VQAVEQRGHPLVDAYARDAAVLGEQLQRAAARAGRPRRPARGARSCELRVDPNLEGVRDQFGDPFPQAGPGFLPDDHPEQVCAARAGRGRVRTDARVPRGCGGELVEGAPHRPQPARGLDRHVHHLRRRSRPGLDDEHGRDGALLAEVDHNRRPGVVDRDRAG
jgi:hypothetical protein